MAQIVAPAELHRVNANVVIYRDDGRFLLIQRAPHVKVWPGKWATPGGGMSSEEYIDTEATYGNGWHLPLHESLKREVREETGLEIGDPQYLLHYTFVRPDGVPVFGMVFYAPYAGGEIALTEADTAQAKWVSLEELDDHDCIGNVPKEIRAVAELLA